MTFISSSQTLDQSCSSSAGKSFDLSVLPPVFLSLTHFSKEAADSLEERLAAHGANISYDISEVRLVLTKVESKRRIQLDLRGHGLWTKEFSPSDTGLGLEAKATVNIGNDDCETESEDDGSHTEEDTPAEQVSQDALQDLASDTVKVIRVEWIEECIAQGRLLPVRDYIVFEGQKVEGPDPGIPSTPIIPAKRKQESPGIGNSASPESILARARADAQETSPRANGDFGIRRFGDKNRSTFTAPYAAGAHSKKPLPLLRETTTEHEAGADADTELTPAPEWITRNLHYSCQRQTPSASPNEAFLDLLKEIRTARLLTGDEIGVRAYSTSIASIASYAYPLHSPHEVLRLPGCDVKLANLFVEYSNTGTLAAAKAAQTDPDLTILRLFYNIWGVGATTARDFYYSRGWKDLDDVVEFGWNALSRVQQIGVKYYDNFLDPIPRDEVAAIGKIIHAHAAKVRDARVQTLVVGGYRRGKSASGDVDILVSHPDEAMTKNLVTDIVASLEEEGCITHTLLLALTSTNRDQQTLPFRAAEARGGGFDTLDKALVVWQDPSWESKAADLKRDKAAKNPAPHRRVDIIVSPWRTVGCAVAGWSGGTTFQRDLRRYAKNELRWKFDSSGVRDRGSGMVVDVEGYYAQGHEDGADGGRGVLGVGKWDRRAQTMEEAERRVFQAMGLDFIEPWNRCTG